MKKIAYLFIIAAAALTLSCKKENAAKYESTPKLDIVSAELEFMPNAAEGKVVVNTQAAVTAVSDREWCVPSVSGNTVTLSITANTSKLSRYAMLNLKAGGAVLDLSVIQYGEVLGGFSEITDITAPVAGDIIEIPITTNVEVLLETEADWVHPSFSEGTLTIKIDPNTEPQTRFTSVSYSAGSSQGSFDVTQYPELVKPEDWIISEQEASYNYPSFEIDASATVGETDMYVLYAINTSKVTGDVDDWIFSDLAISARRSILEKVEGKPGSAFKDFLLTGPQDKHLTGLEVGDIYIIAIGFGENGYVTGKYNYKKATIADIRPAYYKWAGKWKLTGKNIEGADYAETIEIAIDENDVDAEGKLNEKYLIVTGLCSKNQEGAGVTPDMGVDSMKFLYNSETGSMTFVGQDATKTFTHSSRGAGCKLQLMSMYVKSGATSYSNVTGAKFLEVTMKEDGNSTIVKAGIRSDGLAYKAFRMRLLNATGSAYTIGGNAATIAINDNLAITRVE